MEWKSRKEVWPEVRSNFPFPIDNYQEFDAEQLAIVLQEPVRAVYKCISKGQLQTLCIRLLAENAALLSKIKEIDMGGNAS